MSEMIQYKLVPVLSTSPAYTIGDVLFDTTAVQGSIETGNLRGVAIIDKDDVGETCDLYFLKSNVSMGAANAVPSISDINAEEIIGIVSAVSAVKDLGGCRFYSMEFTFPFDVQTEGTIYVAAITQTALTHTASGITLLFRFEKLPT